jgi:HK97 family phage portal protein
VARALGGLLPFSRKTAVGAQVPTWEEGVPQYPKYWHNYWRFALEGYSRNEIVYACVEELATSAAEPRLCGVVRLGEHARQVHTHPLLDLFEHPNPFMSRYQLIAATIMFRAVAGSAYLEIVRSASGRPVELWPLRPDRMFVIPDRQRHIGGWEYRLEHEVFHLPPEDVIQLRTRNAVDDWYGLPPLAVCAERVDTDAMMRNFTLGFFRNGAVPAGLLQITKQVTAAERQLIRDKFRGETGGPQNWHQMLVLDQTEARYTPMGMPLGQAGIVLPDLDEISEARIAMSFGVPLELVGARLGMIHGNRSTTQQARATFWDETLIPLYSEIASDLSRGLLDEPGTQGLDYLEFDLSTVKALAEDEDARHKRVRDDIQSGLISVQEGRELLGMTPRFAPDALLILSRGLEPMLAEQAEAGAPAQEVPGAETTSTKPQAEQAGTPGGAPPAGSAGNGHRALTPADLADLRELAAGR